MPKTYTQKELDKKMNRLRKINRGLRKQVDEVREIESSERIINKRLRERVLDFMDDQAGNRNTKEIGFKEFVEWVDCVTLFDLWLEIARPDKDMCNPNL